VTAAVPARTPSAVVCWRKRVWRWPDSGCPVTTFTEGHDVIGPRAQLTTRAAVWATAALAHDDTTVAALARHLGVDWRTCWDAIEIEATRRMADADRLAGVVTLGVDEHIWTPSHHGGDRAVTSMVDLTRDQAGRVHARLLDVVTGRHAHRLLAVADGPARGVHRDRRARGPGPVPRLCERDP
jgi:transposase